MKKPFTSCILFALAIVIQAQTLPTLWGTSTSGGGTLASSNGTIYKLRSDDSNFSVPYNFGTTNQGWGPYGSLVQASNGLLYGMTSMGGANSGGVIFFLDPGVTNTYTEVHQFDALMQVNSGSQPFGSLIQATDGLLYGMTFTGGLNNDGVIFSFDPTSNAYTDLYDFVGTGGTTGSLMQASNGLMYGMTEAGGTGFGSLFSFDPVSHQFIDNLFDFSGDPSESDGTNYGGNPSGSVIQGLDGNLYGVTGGWGVNDLGVIFSYNITTQVYTDLVDFTGMTGSNIGSGPTGLMQTSDGTLYGLGNAGGAGNDGVLFYYTISPAAYGETDFNGANGVNPTSTSLVQDTHTGLLYGMASFGGANSIGDIFSFNPANHSSGISDLINFDNSSLSFPDPGPGETPYGNSLIQASNGKLYGMTTNGGGSDGNLFAFDPVAVTDIDIIDFLTGYPYTGVIPTGILQAGNGLLYGMTYAGGVYNQGVLYSLNPATDTLIDLFNFNWPSPELGSWGQLMLGSNGKMYGMTQFGGTFAYGNIFSLDTLGTYTSLYSFTNGSTGEYPLGTLVEASNGKLYGTSSMGGGVGDSGVIFSFDLGTNTPTPLHKFAGAAADGSYPGYGNSLVQASNGLLYGLTQNGGANGFGVVYSIDTSGGSYNVLYSFDGVYGGNPTGSLVQANNGLLYGMTNGYNSGVAGGNLFSVDVLGNYTNIVDFNQFGSDGYNPGSILATVFNIMNGNLWVGSDGNLYGSTTDGGFTDGELFKYNYSTPLTDISDFQEIINDMPDEPVGNVIELRSITDSTVSVGVCADSSINVPFVAAGFYTYANVFTAQLSDASGGFSSPVTIGTFSGTRSDTIHATIPNGTTPGTGYRIRVVSSNPAVIGTDNGTNIAIGNTPASSSVSIALTGGSNPTCSGVPVTFTATPVNGGLTPLYYFTVNGNSTGISSSAVYTSSSLNNNDNVAVTMSSSAACAVPAFDTSNDITMTVNSCVPPPSPFQLWGAALGGGANGNGTIFDLAMDGSNFSVAYNFGSIASDGSSPIGVVQAGNGALYGSTHGGGTSGNGILYSYNPYTNTYAKVFDFPGADPYGRLILATNGLMYGLTQNDGTNFVGNLYSLDTLGNYTDLYDFSGAGSDGYFPLGALMQASNGLLYGTTSAGGSGGAGVIFSFDPANPGNPAVPLYSFTGSTDGGDPSYSNSLVQANNGLLFGMTNSGGANNYGVVFSIDPVSSSYNVVWSFDGLPAGNPTNSLVQASNGLLYGMTNVLNGCFFGCQGGSLFSIDPNPGNPTPFTDLLDFTTSTGDNVQFSNGSLYQGSDGNLYGTTTSDGAIGATGTVFQYNYNTSAYTDIHDMSSVNPDGTAPFDNLLQLRSISTSTIAGSPLCAGATVNVPFTITGFFTYANVFTAQLSDASGNFTSPVNIGTLSGDTSGTISATIPGGTATGTGYRIRVVSNNPVLTGSDNGSDIAINVCASVNTWLGGTTDWNTTTNWSLGTVPACADIEDSIPVTAHDPIISVAENASNLVIDDNVTLTVNAALDVCGNLTGGATRFAIIQGTTALTLNGSALQNLSGLISFQNQLALDNTFGSAPEAKLASGSAVNIYDAVVLQNNNTLDVSLGTLTLKSTSVTQAGIIDNFSGSNSGSITGNIVAERYYAAPTTTNSYNQHEMGSPVNTPALSQFGASGTAGYVTDADCDGTKLDISSPYGTVFGYDETHGAACGIQQWKVLTGGNAVNGAGYSIRSGGPGTLSLTGAPNISGNVTLNGTNSGWTNTTLQGYPEQSGWTLASNPYPATLQISAGSLSNNVDAGWDGVGVMVWNTTGGSAGSYQLTTTLAPFQAFMIHITEVGTQSSPTSATYTIYATDRATSSGTFFKEATASTLNITATNQSSGLTDVTTVGFNQNATSGFDPNFDAHKIAGDPDRHTLYTLSNGNWMCQNINQSIEQTPTVPMGFSPGVSGTYTMNFDGIASFDPTSYIMLEDTKTGLMYDVRNGDYTFTSNVSDGWNRFVLHFTPPASINTTNATCSEQGMINIVQPGTAVWNFTLADNNNAILSSGTLNAASPVSASVPVGVYNLTLKDNNGYTVVKTVEVNGVQPVIASFTASANSVNVNQEVTLSSTSASAVMNSWNFSDGTTGNGATVTHAYASEGVYSVTLNSTSTSGCNSSVSNTITVTQSITGVTGLNDINRILIWSNENIVNVDFTQLSKVQANIEIYNILGQKIAEDKYVTSTVYRKEIPNIEEGYIVVSVKNNDEIITKKLFISNVK